ncbi:MAG: thiamine ABC transporter substrate-binding protein, partial [Asgard group archaeon]|nr:thiamine ABC transporter substrate-binding protein [Asgard group archaeon]
MPPKGNEKMTTKRIQIFMLISSIILLPIFGALSDNLNVVQGTNSEFRTFIFNPEAEGELVIYTHDSFIAWGVDPVAVRNKAFYEFGVTHNVTVIVQEFSGMVDALNTLINQKANPQADVVIGIDSVMISRAKEEGILKPITSGVNISGIPASLIAALDPEKYLLPIDFGLIAFIFDTEFITTSSYPEILDLSFDDLITTFGEDFALQDPTLSATGVNFLLYQIIFFEEVLGQDWTDWWKSARGIVSIDKSWSDTWARVFDAKEDHMMVSYGTDPAYNAFFNYSYEQNAAIISHNSEEYSWMQIEGIGIVEGTTNETLAKTYVDYALSPEVQELLATNNWMFPANSDVALPPCYDYAITSENVTILNDLVTSQFICENLQTWINTWERLIYGAGYWWAWVLSSTLLVIVVIIVIIVVYKQKTKL